MSSRSLGRRKIVALKTCSKHEDVIKTCLAGVFKTCSRPSNVCWQCFLSRHIRHLNPLKIHPERITKIKKSLMILIMMELNFLSLKRIGKSEKKNNIYIKVFCYENSLVYPVYVPNEKFEDFMDLLMTEDENKPP